MAFTFSEQHVADFHMLGYTVFRAIVPPALIDDLRRASDKAREIARREKGENTQRLQPVGKYDIDLKPFQDWGELPELNDALARVLSPRHRVGDPERLGILLEPAEMPWCTEWHRDFRDHMPEEVFEAEFREEWTRQVFDLEFMNQVNSPLYEDTSTWFVPGSHYRQENFASEIAARHAVTAEELRKNAGQRSAAEQERFCHAYCEGMPGAVQLALNAGDFALYRPCAWHLGNYVTYRKRATLHDTPLTPAVKASIKDRNDLLKKVMAKR